MIEAVVFDLDDTLVNLPIDYEKLFREFSQIMNKTEVRPLTKTIPKLDEGTRKRIFEAWDKAEREAFANMTVKREGLALYNRYADEPKALVTMQGQTIAQDIIEKLRLSFRFIVTREQSMDRTEQLRTALKKLETHAENALLVGDTDEDSAAAKNLGCQFLRVSE